MKAIKNLLIFASGIGIGYFVGSLLTQKKEQQRSNFEVEEVRKMYKEKLRRENGATCSGAPEKNCEQEKTVPVPEKEETTNIDYAENEGPFLYCEKPYTISAEQFGEDIVGYSTCYLTFYSDHVVADDMDEPLTNDEIADILGEDFFEKMLISDILYIRNNARHCDYEITRDYENYSQNTSKVSSLEIEKKPHDIE